MWKRYRRHKIGVAGLVVILIVLLLTVFAEFFAPYGQSSTLDLSNCPPMRIHIIDSEGNLSRPFVYSLNSAFDLNTGVMEWQEDTSERHYIRFFVKGEPYTLLGIRMSRHFFGSEDGAVCIFGTNSIGQDVFSRILYGGRVSLTIAAVTALITLILGTLTGMISGYFQGFTDVVVQRVVELFLIIPNVPLALALAAFIPADTDPVYLMMGISLVLSVCGWGNVARQIRGKTLAIRSGGYVQAAVSMGASTPRILFKHILPSLYDHLIVLATLTIPQTILAESGLSFLGFGLRAPKISWGSLLQEAQNIRTIGLYPWVMIPGIVIMITVLALNFVGDALRDAVDPYIK